VPVASVGRHLAPGSARLPGRAKPHPLSAPRPQATRIHSSSRASGGGLRPQRSASRETRNATPRTTRYTITHMPRSVNPAV
jgi:hypothetical protein